MNTPESPSRRAIAFPPAIAHRCHPRLPSCQVIAPSQIWQRGGAAATYAVGPPPSLQPSPATAAAPASPPVGLPLPVRSREGEAPRRSRHRLPSRHRPQPPPPPPLLPGCRCLPSDDARL
uniref:Uncharacterized protein n=1 Tax=Oryza sativa subsp. japonica TaxID=39947 RepID=Q5VPA7_ORYSJ|nr:hypothetical protein [Oryza sativa Japonica Group]BAD68718.1 hypothetical protein [Oryza sativa Japonica Group]